jgi:trans-2,3-dihydro-3-hydroxyanthranilate isomerase
MAISRYRYLHFDVFTDRRFGGNQLAVFPEADGLGTAVMQQIAREIGFAETTFVTRPDGIAADVRMRIFTPFVEMPMAGHPVIGSTFALARDRRIPAGRERWQFGLNAGLTPVELEWNASDLAFAWMTQKLPVFGPTFDGPEVANAVGLPAAAMRPRHLPIQQVSCGVPFVIVPVATRAEVDAAVPSANALLALAERSGEAHFSIYLFSTERDPAGKDEATVYTRMFGPGLGIYEDPATGSASGPLGCYLVANSIVDAHGARSILNLQGRKLGRPSWIRIAIDADGPAISRVRVGGTSVFVAEGSMDVED